MDIFISHSSHDVVIARAVIELIRSALNIPADRIRCTNVEGYKLPAGSATDDQIRRELLETKVLLGIISPASNNLMYVAFELGARWDIEKPLIPLTTSKVGVELLKGPLKNINALNSTVRADVLQLVTDLGNYLSITPQQPSVYDNKVTELVELSLVETLPTKDEAALNDRMASSESTDEFYDAEAIIKQHCLSEWPEDFSMRKHCIDEQKKALEGLKKARPDDIPLEVFQQIRRKAAADWPTDYTMRLHAEKEQTNSYRQLNE